MTKLLADLKLNTVMFAHQPLVLRHNPPLHDLLLRLRPSSAEAQHAGQEAVSLSDRLAILIRLLADQTSERPLRTRFIRSLELRTRAVI